MKIKHASERYIQREVNNLEAKVNRVGASVSKSGHTSTIRIVDTNGTETVANVFDGHDGADGIDAQIGVIKCSDGKWHKISGVVDSDGAIVCRIGDEGYDVPSFDPQTYVDNTKTEMRNLRLITLLQRTLTHNNIHL